MNSPGFHQVFYFSQNFTNSPGFHHVFIFHKIPRSLVNSPGFHQVSTLEIFSWILTVKADNFHQKKAQSASFGEFQSYKALLAFWFGDFFKNLVNSPRLPQNLVNSPGLFFHKIPQDLVNSPGCHQVLQIAQYSTRISPSFFSVTKFHKTWWIYQVFTRFFIFTKFQFFIFHKIPENLVNSSGFHQVFYFYHNSTKPGEFSRFSPSSLNFTVFHRISPNFLSFTKFHKTWWIHQVCTRFSPGSLFFT